MSEEVKNETVETPEVQQNSETTIEWNGQQLTPEQVKEMMYQRDVELEKLKDYNSHASKLFTSNYADEAEKLNSVKYLLQKEGYSPEQISEYVNSLANENVQPEPQIEEAIVPEETPAQPNRNEEYEAILRQQQEKIQQLEENQRKLTSGDLKKDLNTSVETVFNTNKEINNLLQRFNSLNNSEGKDQRSELMKQEIMKETMENLRKRKLSGGMFDKSWFAEETNRAADSVVAKFRTVIGDPNKIQRSPETESEFHSFLNSKPVEAPSFEPSDRVMGRGDTKVKTFTTDALSRLAAEMGLGDETKV